MCFGNAKKSMEGSEGGRTLAPPAPEAAFSPEGTAGAAQWRLGESRVCLRSGLRTALGQAGGEGGGGDGGGEGGAAS